MAMSPPGTPQEKSNRWIIGGCVALFACVVVGCIGVFGGLYWLGTQTAEEIAVETDAPLETQMEEPIEFSVEIANITAEAITLDSIDVSLTYLNGIAIETTNPPYTETSQYDSFGEAYQTFYYQVSIAPGETLTVVFNGRAVSAGDFTGQIDVCIDSFYNCKSNVVRTIIK